MTQTDSPLENTVLATTSHAAIDPDDMPLFREFQSIIAEISRSLTSEMLDRLQHSVANWEQEIEAQRQQVLKRLDAELTARLEGGLRKLPERLDEAASQIKATVVALQPELHDLTRQAMEPLGVAASNLSAVITRCRGEFDGLLTPVLTELQRIEAREQESVGSLKRLVEMDAEQQQRAQSVLTQQGKALSSSLENAAKSLDARLETVHGALLRQGKTLSASVEGATRLLDARLGTTEQNLRAEVDSTRRQVAAIEGGLAAARKVREQLAAEESRQFQTVNGAVEGLQKQLQGLSQQQEEMLSRHRQQSVVLWALGIVMVLLELTHWLGLGLHR